MTDESNMRKLVLQSECGIIRKMIDISALPNDLSYPVYLVTAPNSLTVADAKHRKWEFEI